MDHIITTEEYTKALEIIRENFKNLNKDLLDELSNCEKTGRFRYRQAHHMEYKDFYDTLKIGFQSLDLHQLFEAMAYLYFFKGIVTVSLEMEPYINFDKFNSKGFFKEVRSTLKTLIAVNVLEAWVRQSLLTLKINPEKILSKPDSLLSCTLAIQYAKERKLHHFGNAQFIISKIDFEASNHIFNTKLVIINPNIFYTSNPTQIINFTTLAKPGVYIIANIPYGQYQDTAFYIIFRQEKFAYIIENNKHSYRDQIYRTKSDGTSGQDAFLEMKYDHTYFPIQLVIDFLQKQSSSTNIINPETLNFIPLGNIFDCCPEIVLWNYAFIDTCAQHLLKEDFAQQISLAACIDFIKPEITSTDSNLPAVYTSALPSLTSLDLSWSAKKIDAKGHITTGTPLLDTFRPNVTLEQISLPVAKITSLEQLHRELIFNKRKKEAEIMQETINKDFIEHFDSVKNHILKLLHKKGVCFIALKSQKFTYPKTVYPQPKKVLFHEGDEDEVKENPKIIQVPLLQIFDSKKRLLQENSAPLGRCVFYNEPPFRGKPYCDLCRTFPTLYFFALDFKEYAHFKSFLEITDDSTVPAQLKDFLSQDQKIGYIGNPLLDDIDPMAMVQIPWWKTSLCQGEIIKYRNDRNICLPIRFGLCGKCQNKIRGRPK
jgi:hypothetical protein